MTDYFYNLEIDPDYTVEQMMDYLRINLGRELPDNMTPLWYRDWSTYEEGGFSSILQDNNNDYYVVEWASSVYADVNDSTEAEIQPISEIDAIQHMIEYEKMVDEMPECII